MSETSAEYDQSVQLPGSEIASEANHNGLDNRRHNLRPTDGQSQNLMNMTKTTSPTSSKYKGVCWHKAAKKWMASIKLHGKPIYIGLFVQERNAAEAYNKSAQHLFGLRMI
jgi:hypothetical protein